ncbi:MAG: hypothetical protein ABII22_03525 [Candidatus Micrarchaeota archaeon]
MSTFATRGIEGRIGTLKGRIRNAPNQFIQKGIEGRIETLLKKLPADHPLRQSAPTQKSAFEVYYGEMREETPPIQAFIKALEYATRLTGEERKGYTDALKLILIDQSGSLADALGADAAKGGTIKEQIFRKLGLDMHATKSSGPKPKPIPDAPPQIFGEIPASELRSGVPSGTAQPKETARPQTHSFFPAVGKLGSEPLVESVQPPPSERETVVERPPEEPTSRTPQEEGEALATKTVLTAIHALVPLNGERKTQVTAAYAQALDSGSLNNVIRRIDNYRDNRSLDRSDKQAVEIAMQIALEVAADPNKPREPRKQAFRAFLLGARNSRFDLTTDYVDGKIAGIIREPNVQKNIQDVAMKFADDMTVQGAEKAADLIIEER